MIWLSTVFFLNDPPLTYNTLIEYVDFCINFYSNATKLIRYVRVTYMTSQIGLSSSVVCQSSVSFMYPTQPIMFLYHFVHSHRLTFCNILQRSSQGTLPSGVKRKGVAKCYAVGPVEGTETVQDTASCTIDD